MTGTERITSFIDALNAAGIPYMITGSLACNLYGIPRSTQDADFVVQLDPSALQRLATLLAPAITLDPRVSFEAVTMTTRYAFHCRDHEFKIELFLLSPDAHDQERFQRRGQSHLEGRSVSVPTAEDVIITKLRWIQRSPRSKDIQDVMNILAVQGDRLDWAYIRRWSTEHGTLSLLDDLRGRIPPV